MLSRWFKRSSRLEHPDREVRLQALQALNAEQAADAQATLESIALGDVDLEVRLAALPHVSNPDTLTQLLVDPDLASATATQIATQVRAGNSSSLNEHPRVLQARITQAQANDIDALWPLLMNAEQCAQLALRLRDDARERLLTHPLLNDESGLSVLQKVARGKDKNCHRHARERLDLIKKARTSCTDSQARLSELDVAIAKALKSPPKDDANQRAHIQKLNQLQGMREQAITSIAEAQQALSDIGGITERLDIPPDPLAGINLALPDPADDPFIPLLEKLSRLATGMREGIPVSQAVEQRDEVTSAWLSHADSYPANTQQHQQFENVSQHFQDYRSAWQRLQAIKQADLQTPDSLSESAPNPTELQALLSARTKWRKRWHKPLQQLIWPVDHIEPEEIAMLKADLQRIDGEIERLSSLLKRAETDMAEAVSAASTAIEAGQFEQATEQLRGARRLQKAGINAFDRELGSLSAQVAEFRDWQQYATDPKREQLLTEIKSLCENPQEPPTQAARIKSLREQWQQLGRSTSAHEADLRRQFDGFADTAFAPCRVYYAEQSEMRAENLAQRQALCDQLTDYLQGTDWGNADMQAAESILRSAREEWHKHHPCERRALKSVEHRFETLQGQLFDKVKAAWDGNLQAKQDIVAQAQALLEQDTAAQVNGAKNLQRAWREVGTTPRGPDQRLWKQFRQICDQIFEQRDVQQQADKVEFTARQQTLEESVRTLEAGAQQAQPSRKTLSGLRDAVNVASEGLNVSATLRKRIEQAVANYNQALQQEDRHQVRRDLQQWQQWDELVSQAEQAGHIIEAPHAVFASRVKGDAQSANWLNLTLEAEIAAEIPTPPTDQTARMALQVEFMNAGRRNLAMEDLSELRKRWCEAGPKTDSENDLRVRFFIALEKRL
jgi:exonuclease SbcC